MWLDIQLDITIGAVSLSNYKFYLKKDNYLTFLTTKIDEFADFKFSGHPTIKVEISLRSLKTDLAFSVTSEFRRADITSNCKKTKVFNYYITKHLCLVFFEGDSSILYGLLEISATDILMNYLTTAINAKSRMIKDSNVKKDKFITKVERLAEIRYYDINEYLRDETDFEVIVSIHNGLHRVFYFINTITAVPFLDQAMVRFTFKDIGEPLESEDFSLYFDTGLGISESVDQLVYCEVIIKGHRGIIFIDSGIRFVSLEKSSAIDLGYLGSQACFRAVNAKDKLFEYNIDMVTGRDEGGSRLERVDLIISPLFFIN